MTGQNSHAIQIINRSFGILHHLAVERGWKPGWLTVLKWFKELETQYVPLIVLCPLTHFVGLWLLCFKHNYEMIICGMNIINPSFIVRVPHSLLCWSMYGFPNNHFRSYLHWLSNLRGASRQSRGVRGYWGPGKFSCSSSWRTPNHKWHRASTADLMLIHAEARNISEALSGSL